MRGLGWLAAGLVLGFLLGGILPRLENTELRRERDEAVKQAEDAERRGITRSAGRMLIPGMGEMLPQGGRSADAPTEEVEPTEDGAPPPDMAGAPPGPPPDAAQMRQEFDLAVAGQRARSQQARQAIQEQADLSDEEMAQLDTVFAKMNQALSEHAYEVLDIAQSGEEPAPAEMLGITHDVTGILYEAQVSMEDIIGSEAVATMSPEAAQVWNQVDLEAFRPALEEYIAAQEAGGGAP